MVLARKVALKELHVLTLVGGEVMIVANEQTGLEPVKQGVLLLQVPVKGSGVAVVVPHAVKPNGIGVVVLDQLGELGIHETVVELPVGLGTVAPRAVSRASLGVVLTHPVEVGIIEMHSQSLTAALVGKLTQHVATEGGAIYDIVAGLLGGKHGEAVMVACGETDVLGAGLLECRHPSLGIEQRRIEPMGSPGILMPVDTGIMHIPLSLAKHAVDAPMQENAETAFGEGGTRLEIFLGRPIGATRPGIGGERNWTRRTQRCGSSHEKHGEDEISM